MAVPIEASNVALPVVVHRELAERVEEIAKLARRTGLWILFLMQERDGLLVGHVPRWDIGSRPNWVDCGFEDAVPGWRYGVLALDSVFYEYDSGLSGFFFSLGALWRRGGEMELSFLTQEPVGMSEEEVPPVPIAPQQLSLFRSRMRAQVRGDGLSWTRGTFVLDRWIGGKFRQIKLLGRADSGRFKGENFLGIERFLAPKLKLVGTPGSDA
ncbi:MAG: hypothetical protein CSA62_01685 [Planctomycetota bacterium]|nr:MAG: hypothetical protein CSA62_01685 [Planctomycetota bacterium]